MSAAYDYDHDASHYSLSDEERDRATRKPQISRDFPAGFEWDAENGTPSYQLYTAREVADGIGVVERTVRRWIEQGKLPAEKQGGVFRIRMEDARRVYAESRGANTVAHSALATYVEWLEAENARLWQLLEKAVVR